MKRVLVTGAGGFVGSRIMQQLADRMTLLPFPQGALAYATRSDVERLVERLHPDAILHTAAISDTGYCEAHPDESFRANVEVPLWFAQAARSVGARLVAFSSDQVYAGLKGRGPFDETTPLSPSNVYGRQKREAEQRILDVLPRAVLLRATWLYDLPGYRLPIRGNLPLNLLRAARLGEPLRFSCRDYRGVTYVRQAVENLLPALALPGGVYNFGSENDADTYDTALHFCTVLGIHPTLEQTSWSRSLLMDTRKARAGGILFDTTAEGTVHRAKSFPIVAQNAKKCNGEGANICKPPAKTVY